MANPFHFGQRLPSRAFVNRTAELERLVSNFRRGQSTVVIAPRRWGKTVLVHEAARRACERDKRLRVVHLDLTAVRDEREFVHQFLTALVNATESEAERRISLVTKFLRGVVPRLKYTVDHESSVELAIGFEDGEDANQLQGILDLPERIAEARDLRIVVAIDEFQEVNAFGEGQMDRILRSKWQHHARASYCLYGSKYHMMTELFGSYKRPFYHFGDVIYLQRIAKPEWTAYLVDTFRRAGRRLDPDAADLLVDTVDAHSHYVQRLAMETYATTGERADLATVREAYENLVRTYGPLFEQLVNPLTQSQLNFLLAIAEGAQELSSERTRRRYRLGSSSNVTKMRRTMRDREFVWQAARGELALLDPVFGEWLKRLMGPRAR